MRLLGSLLTSTMLTGCEDSTALAQAKLAQQQMQLTEKIQSDGYLSPDEFSEFVRKHDLKLSEYQAIQAGLSAANSSGVKRELAIANLDCSIPLDNGYRPRACYESSRSVLYNDVTGEIVRNNEAEHYERAEGTTECFWAVNDRPYGRDYNYFLFSDESPDSPGDALAGPFLGPPTQIMEGKNGPIWYGMKPQAGREAYIRGYRGVTGSLFTKSGPIDGSGGVCTEDIYYNCQGTDVKDLFVLTLAEVLRQPGFPAEFTAAIQKYQTNNGLPSNAEVLVIRKPHDVPSFGSQMDTNWTSSGIFERSGDSTSISSTVANNSQSAWYGALSPDGDWIVYTWPESQNVVTNAMVSAD